MPDADFIEGVLLSFEGEVYGELLFDALAAHESADRISAVWALIATMERITRERLEPIARRCNAELDESARRGRQRAREGIQTMRNESWREVVAHFIGKTSAAMARYEALLAAAPESERVVIGQVCAHGKAFAACMRHLQEDRTEAAARCIEAFLDATPKRNDQ